jgi:DNA primase
MTDLDGILDHLDDPEKKIEIYTSFISKARLEDEDREKLKAERGFNDDIIDACKFKSCCPSNREIIKELEATYGEEPLIDAGILEITDKGIRPCTQLLGVYKDEKFVNNICIPYFNDEGDIFFLRPHKFGFKGLGINLYCPAHDMSADKTWVITESEFKAAAALQFGYPVIGVPGIHSFAASNFERLKDFIEQRGISKVVIIYDNEIKNNPEFSNYKPEILKQWDTQWRAVDLCRKLLRSIPDLSFAKIGVLPDSWMVDGKIDIDGALAQGKNSSEFRAVVYSSIEWEDYLRKQPSICRKIIRRKIYKEDYILNSPLKRKESGYYVQRSKKIRGNEEPLTYEEKVSNFTMEIKKTLIEGEIHIREIVFSGQDGSVSKPRISGKGNNLLRDFKSWAHTCGDYHFTGKQEDLDLIWQFEGAMGDGREIQRPEHIGFLKDEDEPLWLFKNAILKEDGSILTPDKDGNIWLGLTGYLPQSIKQGGKKSSAAIIPTLNLDENLNFGLPELKDIAKKMEVVFQTKATSLAIGWIISCLFSEEIFRKYACFPILFIGGKRESGKTTLGNWLMAMTGQADAAGEALGGGSSQPGVIRNLSWYSSLPYWLDEYRNSKSIKTWDGFFRNIYQRQSASKGTLGANVRSQAINAGIILSGEETPQDNALLSRCVVIPLVKARSKDSLDIYREIENLRTNGYLSRLMLEVIKVKQKLMPVVLKHIDGWKKRMLDEGVGERISLNYAIPAVCYDILFNRDEDIATRKEFTRWVVEESHRTELEKESEHMLSVFMEDLVTLHEKVENFYTVFTQNKEAKGKRRMAIHFPTFYTVWTETYRRKGHEQFKRGTMLSYIKEEPYYLQDKLLKRIHGKPTRSLILSLDPEDNPPDGLIYLADGITPVDDNLSDAIASLSDDDALNTLSDSDAPF